MEEKTKRLVDEFKEGIAEGLIDVSPALGAAGAIVVVGTALMLFVRAISF